MPNTNNAPATVSRFLDLAEEWREEDRGRPDRETPHDIAAARIAKIRAMLDGKFDA